MRTTTVSLAEGVKEAVMEMNDDLKPIHFAPLGLRNWSLDRVRAYRKQKAKGVGPHLSPNVVFYHFQSGVGESTDQYMRVQSNSAHDHCCLWARRSP
jgi:hypothetical protein